jgi:hypothetical protein
MPCFSFSGPWSFLIVSSVAMWIFPHFNLPLNSKCFLLPFRSAILSLFCSCYSVCTPNATFRFSHEHLHVSQIVQTTLLSVFHPLFHLCFFTSSTLFLKWFFRLKWSSASRRRVVLVLLKQLVWTGLISTKIMLRFFFARF